MSKKRTPTIDAHQHLWKYSFHEYGWIDESMKVLQRDFMLPDLERVSAEAGVDGTIAVQARQSLEETEWLLSIAQQSALVRGVVGWAPIASEDFPEILERLKSSKKLKGLRHVIQGEPDDNYINRQDFNRGIKALAGSSLVYDILIFERHLAAAIRFVDRHPNQIFVLDHAAKPRIREKLMKPWKQHIYELARRPNVCCKLSGLVTEAHWMTWSEEDLRPYFDVAIAAFTPSRIMFGSDWPVCLAVTTYQRWLECFSRLIDQLSAMEKDRVMGATAIEVYNLQD